MALLAAFLAGPAACAQVSEPGSDSVTVRLFEAFPPAGSMYLRGPFLIAGRVFAQGLFLIESGGGGLLMVPLSAHSRYPAVRAAEIVVRPLPGGLLKVGHASKRWRRYRGHLRFTLDESGNVTAHNQVSRRDYVVSVVGSETGPGWPYEALKCQAVLTQTRLARFKPGDSLGDSTQAEAYMGADFEFPQARQAVLAVWGKTLSLDGSPASVYYHSTCAGGTSDGDTYFLGARGRLRGLPHVPCSYCRPSPNWAQKEVRIPYREFVRAFMDGVPAVVRRDECGRPLALRFANGRQVSGYQFWIDLGRRLGWDKAPGTRFDIRREGDGYVVIKSSGAGHGVGLCQWGAAGLARAGKSYRSILSNYFPSATISP